MHGALGSIPASKRNDKLCKMVAIFTLALEGNSVAHLSIGSCFTVTLDSDDGDSFFPGGWDRSLVVLPRDLVCDHVLPFALQILPQCVWLSLISCRHTLPLASWELVLVGFLLCCWRWNSQPNPLYQFLGCPQHGCKTSCPKSGTTTCRGYGAPTSWEKIPFWKERRGQVR